MKIHAQCDRCKKYEEAPATDSWRPPEAPAGWTHLRAFTEPISLNAPYMLPAGAIQALLCGDCLPIVQRAVEAAIARKT